MTTTARERPLTLRAAEVRAVLDGRKTQSRVVARIAENGGLRLTGPYVAFARDSIGLVWRPYGGAPEQPMPPEKVSEYSPVGQVGDRLWVRETWSDAMSDAGPVICYRADLGRRYLYLDAWPIEYDRYPGCRFANWATDLERGIEGYWRRSTEMPPWASRLTLEITGVRIERLAAISEEDAQAEGAQDSANYSHRAHFARLWDETRGRKPGRSWADSPWVWAISFRRIGPC